MSPLVVGVCSGKISTRGSHHWATIFDLSKDIWFAAEVQFNHLVFFIMILHFKEFRGPLISAYTCQHLTKHGYIILGPGELNISLSRPKGIYRYSESRNSVTTAVFSIFFSFIGNYACSSSIFK